MKEILEAATTKSKKNSMESLKDNRHWGRNDI